MAGLTCPSCGSSRITNGKCEYCGSVVEETKPEKDTPDQAVPEQRKGLNEQQTQRIVIILIACLFIIIGVAVWHKVSPYTMPIWLQQIVIDVRKFFGDDSYTFYYGSQFPMN